MTVGDDVKITIDLERSSRRQKNQSHLVNCFCGGEAAASNFAISQFRDLERAAARESIQIAQSRKREIDPA